MIYKSALRKSIQDVLGEHEIEDDGIVNDMVDRLVQDFGDEVQDDDEEAEDVVEDEG